MDSSLGDKTIGYAKKALQAYIKALDMAQGSTNPRRWSYVINKGEGTASILDTQGGQAVEGFTKPLTEHARLGRQLRRTEIALADTVLKLLQIHGGNVRYTFNAITGEAFIARNGNRITELPDFLQEYIMVKKIGQGGQPLSNMPSTLEGWALIGRQVEADYWKLYNDTKQALEAAQVWGSESGIKDFLAKFAEVEQALVLRKMYRVKDQSQRLKIIDGSAA